MRTFEGNINIFAQIAKFANFCGKFTLRKVPNLRKNCAPKRNLRKIAILREKVKFAQKLCPARSRFSSVIFVAQTEQFLGNIKHIHHPDW